LVSSCTMYLSAVFGAGFLGCGPGPGDLTPEAMRDKERGRRLHVEDNGVIPVAFALQGRQDAGLRSCGVSSLNISVNGGLVGPELLCAFSSREGNPPGNCFPFPCALV
jgi:hypothetical protein